MIVSSLFYPIFKIMHNKAERLFIIPRNDYRVYSLFLQSSRLNIVNIYHEFVSILK